MDEFDSFDQFDIEYDRFQDDAAVWEESQLWLETQEDSRDPDEESFLGEDEVVTDSYWSDDF
jgi:hypothetical protein